MLVLLALRWAFLSQLLLDSLKLHIFILERRSWVSCSLLRALAATERASKVRQVAQTSPNICCDLSNLTIDFVLNVFKFFTVVYLCALVWSCEPTSVSRS
jgi:hypothetical protein